MEKKETERINKVLERLNGLEEIAGSLVDKVDSRFQPMRSSFVSRYPVAFLLFSTGGVVMTFLGIEQLVLEWTWLSDRPYVMTFFGVAILFLTGTLYRKLG